MQLADGVELDRIGYNDEWSKVWIEGETYYVCSEFVKAEGDSIPVVMTAVQKRIRHRRQARCWRRQADLY